MASVLVGPVGGLSPPAAHVHCIGAVYQLRVKACGQNTAACDHEGKASRLLWVNLEAVFLEWGCSKGLAARSLHLGK